MMKSVISFFYSVMLKYKKEVKMMKNVVYHGSSNGNIEKLKAHKSTHQKNVFMQQTIK